MYKILCTCATCFMLRLDSTWIFTFFCGMTFGLTRFLSRLFQSYSHMQKILRFLSVKHVRVRSSMIFFICHYQRKFMCNLLSFHNYLLIWIYKKNLVFGHTSGIPTSSPFKGHMLISLAGDRFILLFHGFGRVVVRIRGKSSSGC